MTQRIASDTDWADNLAFRDGLRKSILSRTPRTEEGRDLANIDFDRIALLSLWPDRAADMSAAVSEAAAAGAAGALSRVRQDGEIVLAWPGGETHRMPAGAAVADQVCWMRSLACALAARDAEAIGILCDPAHLRAVQQPEKLADPYWPFLCAAMAALAVEPAAAPAWLDDAEKLLAPEEGIKGDPDIVRRKLRPLAALMRALASAEGDFDTALGHALGEYRELYAHREPSEDPAQLLYLEALGLAALAFDRGRRFDCRELPAALVRGELPRQQVTVTYDYAPRRAERVEDPIAFLDLEGFPRAGRTHQLVERDGSLLAVYTLRGRPACPRAQATFVLQGGAPATPSALDPGERVLLADAYAQRAESGLKSARAEEAIGWLSQAVAQLEAVLQAVDPASGSVPDSAFVHYRGQRARQAEPGRFRRDRLEAYRAALQARIAKLRSPDAPEVFAGLAAEAVAEQARPLLTALAKSANAGAISQLRPQSSDYARLFQPGSVEKARAAYEALWASGPEWTPPAPAQSELLIFAAPAGLLGSPNGLSRHFPGGYASIANHLLPHRVWLCWKYTKPGEESGLAFDGLVWCDDHWAWFPKPYRVLLRS